jgi:hypothetical protein
MPPQGLLAVLLYHYKRRAWRYRSAIFDKAAAKALYAGSYLVSFAIALVLAFLGGVILYGF